MSLSAKGVAHDCDRLVDSNSTNFNVLPTRAGDRTGHLVGV